jgi:hypothetical protein
MIVNGMHGFGRRESWPISEYYPDILLNTLMDTSKHLIQDLELNTSRTDVESVVGS